MRHQRQNAALAIGGLDPGGGAGIVADLRAFERAGAFGCAALAVMTVQSTAGLVRATAVSAAIVSEQAEEVLAHQRIRAIKIGALGSAANVRAVARLLEKHRAVPGVIDTPMLPTRGDARLLVARGVAAMRAELIPRATLLTVNVNEAEVLLGVEVTDVASARKAARALCAMGARAALVKGGHLRGREAIDVLALRERAEPTGLVELRAPRLALPRLHGAGCTFASLVAGRLAIRSGSTVTERALVGAVRWAKRVHHAALARAADVGGPMRVVSFR